MLLNPLSAEHAPFKLRVLQWTVGMLQQGVPLEPISKPPARYNDFASYSALWKSLVLEEARAAMEAGIGQGKGKMVEMVSVAPGAAMGHWAGMRQPAQLVIGGGAEGLDAGSAVLLGPAPGAPGNPLLAICVHKRGTSVVLEAVSNEVQAGASYQLHPIESLIAHERMYSALLQLEGSRSRALPQLLRGAAPFRASNDGPPCIGLNGEQRKAVGAARTQSEGVLLVQGPFRCSSNLPCTSLLGARSLCPHSLQPCLSLAGSSASASTSAECTILLLPYCTSFRASRTLPASLQQLVSTLAARERSCRSSWDR